MVEQKDSNCVTGTGNKVLPKIQRGLKSLQGKLSTSKQPSEEPPAKRKKIDLIFRDVLQASLGDSSENKPCYTESECKSVRRSDINIPGFKEEVEQEEEQGSVSSAEPSTSFCPNCVKLKKRILELEEELRRLRGEQRDDLSMSEKNLTQNDQSLPHPDQAPIEDSQGMLFKSRGALSCRRPQMYIMDKKIIIETVSSIWFSCQAHATSKGDATNFRQNDKMIKNCRRKVKKTFTKA